MLPSQKTEKKVIRNVNIATAAIVTGIVVIVMLGSIAYHFFEVRRVAARASAIIPVSGETT